MSRVELPDIFENGMMLQREKPIKIWGTGAENSKLVIQLGESKESVQIKNGRFFCELPSMSAGVGWTLLFFIEGEVIPEIKIENISIGDIWIAAGQSNMEYFLRYDAHWNDVKRQPINENIHMYNCPRIAYLGQKREQPDSGHWFLEQQPQWESFSAPGYSFARAIQPVLDVPVGIIGCNWGGTPACAWMESSYFEEDPLCVFSKEYEEAVSKIEKKELEKRSMEAWEFEDSYLHQIAWRAMMYGMNEEDQKRWMKENAKSPLLPMGPYHQYRPGGLYEEMVKKIAPFGVKGVLWYQGESDSNHADIYDITFTKLIDCWRKTWKDELPFLFVQLAPFGKWLDCDGTNYSVVREKQELVEKFVPNTGMVSIMDLGMYEDIHPKQKMEVGERLALLARGLVYGEDVLCESPEFIDAECVGNRVVLTFSHTGKSLYLKGEQIKSLVIYQGGRKRKIKTYQIDASITLFLEEQTKEPIEILFAKESYCEVNLFNEAGLPVKPFSFICEVKGDYRG
ncbi:MAG: sialate O-acetylesterase [Velocimicrobium sp.]